MSSDIKPVARVVDGSGTPLSGRVVVGRNEGDTDPVGHWITDEDGEFTLATDGGASIDPADVSFTVRDPKRGGSESPIASRELDDSGEAPTVELRVTSAATPIHGSVEHRGMNDAATTRMGRVRSTASVTSFRSSTCTSGPTSSCARSATLAKTATAASTVR